MDGVPSPGVRFGLLPKFLLALSLPIVVVSVGLATSSARTMSRRMVADLEARGSYLARSLAKTGQYGVFTSYPEILHPLVEGAFESGDLLYIEIVDSEGVPLVLRPAEGFDPTRRRPLEREEIRHLSTFMPSIERIETGSPPRYDFVFPVILEKPGLSRDEIVLGGEAGEPPSPPRGTLERIGAVRLGISLGRLRENIATTQRQVATIAAQVAFITLGLAILFVRRVLRPIEDLAAATREVSQGNFAIRAPARGNDELGLLGHAFNQMAERVEGFQQSLERKVEERTQALAAKTKDMEEFVYTVSHDLKAPVVSTHGLVSLLAEEFGPTLPPDARIYVDRIKANASHMEKLIQDLFELSRIDRRTKPLEVVDTKVLLQEVLLEHDAEIRSANVSVVVDEALPASYGERDHLTQVFDNLIGNAIKFRKRDSPGRIWIGGKVEGSSTAFTVSDDGIGIDASHHERIFGLFQRLHTEREYPGTGLGLAIVKKIVEKHGGNVRVESESGKGSTFHVTLPSAPA